MWLVLFRFEFSFNFSSSISSIQIKKMRGMRTRIQEMNHFAPIFPWKTSKCSKPWLNSHHFMMHNYQYWCVVDEFGTSTTITIIATAIKKTASMTCENPRKFVDLNFTISFGICLAVQYIAHPIQRAVGCGHWNHINIFAQFSSMSRQYGCAIGCVATASLERSVIA